MARISGGEVLRSLGYSFIELVEKGEEPEHAPLSFKDLVPELSGLEIGDKLLYKHQLEAYEELGKGKNVILRAGTGSGKTEAWALYLLKKIKEGRRFRAIALYPTLVLANDQIKRLRKYVEAVKGQVIQLDSVKREELVEKMGSSSLRIAVGSANLVITNPAFLLHDLKKFIVKRSGSLLASAFEALDLLVIDEVDFYTPRSIALLLAIIKVLSSISDRKPQVVILTATLSNPEDVGEFLKAVTGREYAVIEGKPFRVENRTYIVLGKDLEGVWRYVRDNWEKYVAERPELGIFKDAIEDFELFKKSAIRVLTILEAAGFDVPSLSVKPEELIAKFAEDEYLTIVFTRSINSAEELFRAIREKFGDKLPMATHHHLVPKRKREEIEEKARNGEIKVIISPRTLSQGIDIGTVARIIHLGLPDDVREFYQREGRKGRRPELLFSESIIIPYSRWDRELLSSGIETFRSWLNMGIERTLVNPGNLYIHLFTGLSKLLSPWLPKDLSEEEARALEAAGVLTKEGLNAERAKDVYEKLNFYEFAPPYGIKRYLEKNGERLPLEPIGHCDLVEKFQPGCIDYGEDALVISLEKGESSRYVKAVIEKPIRDIDLREHDALGIAFEEYRHVKLKWGERPQFIRDLLTGRITSEELCVVYTPRNGFGKYTKVPYRCIWTVRSERPRYVMRGRTPIIYFDKRTIYVPMPTGGEYRDFTYGYAYSVDPREDAELLRLALAALMVILRRSLGIPFETIMYDIVKVGESKYFGLHEPEAAGIIDKLDWKRVREIVEDYQFDDLDRILISEIDDIAYSTLVEINFDWDIVRQQLLRAIDYILLRNKILVVLRDKAIAVPEPNPALRRISAHIFAEVLDKEPPLLVVGLGYFDGRELKSAIALYPPVPYIRPPAEISSLEKEIVDKLVYEDFALVVEDAEPFLKQCRAANLKLLVNFIENNRSSVISLRELAARAGLSSSAEEIAVGLGLGKPAPFANALLALRDIGEEGAIRDRARKALSDFLANYVKNIYIAHLVAERLRG